MPSRSLLGYLVPRLTTQAEVVATEGLTYLLQASATTRDVFDRMAERLGIDFPPLVYDTQVVAADPNDRSRPDVVGFDPDGHKRLVIEAKFWATFTTNQPYAYLKQLDGEAAVLVVLVPRSRLTLVATELETRCRDAGIQLAQLGLHGHWAVATSIGPRMTVVSWDDLLSDFDAALRSKGEEHLAFEVRELLAYCQQADQESFHPLLPEELYQPTPGRILQYLALVGEIVREAEKERVVARGKLTVGATPQRFGQYFWIRGAGAWIGVDYHRWATVQSTPLWIEIANAKFRPDPSLNASLAPLKARGLLLEEPRRAAAVAVRLRPGKEKDALLQDAVLLLKEIGELIAGGRDIPHIPADPGTVP